jgi:hypothetical protein
VFVLAINIRSALRTKSVRSRSEACGRTFASTTGRTNSRTSPKCFELPNHAKTPSVVRETLLPPCQPQRPPQLQPLPTARLSLNLKWCTNQWTVILLFAIAKVAAKVKRNAELWKSRLKTAWIGVLRPTGASTRTSGRRTAGATWPEQVQPARQTKR